MGASEYLKKRAQQQRDSAQGKSAVSDFLKNKASEQRKRQEEEKKASNQMGAFSDNGGSVVRQFLDSLEAPEAPEAAHTSNFTWNVPADPMTRHERQNAVSLGEFYQNAELRKKYGNNYDNYLNDNRRSFDSSAEYEETVARAQRYNSQLDLKNAQSKVAEAQKTGEEMATEAQRLERSAANLQGLLARYQQTGSVVDGQSYLLAVETHNQAVAAYNEKYKAYEKQWTDAQKGYESARQKAVKDETAYVRAYDRLRKEQEAETTRNANHPQNKSYEELQQMIDDIDQQITDLTVSGSQNTEWDFFLPQNQNQDQIDKLRQEKAELSVYLYRAKTREWETEQEQAILSHGGTDLMAALTKYAQLKTQKDQAQLLQNADTPLKTNFYLDRKLAETDEQLRSYGMTDEQLGQWKAYAERMYNAEGAEKTEAMMREQAQSGLGGALAASAMSVPLGETSFIGLVNILGQTLQREITGSDIPVDYNNWTTYGAKASQAATGGVAEKIAEKTAGKVGSDTIFGNLYSNSYQLAMSMVNSLASGGATILLGGSAAISGIEEALERGANQWQALGVGLLYGAAEMVFEKVSLDRLFDTQSPKGWKDAVLNILKQGGVEASEETFTTIANTLGDMIIMGDKSQLKTQVRTLMGQGMSKAEAEKAALLSWGVGLVGDAIGGAVSGGLFGAGGNLVTADYSRKKTDNNTFDQPNNAFDQPNNAIAKPDNAIARADNAQAVGEMNGGIENERQQNFEREQSADGSGQREDDLGSGGSSFEQNRQNASEDERNAEKRSQIQSYVNDLRKTGRLSAIDARKAGVAAAEEGSVLEVISENDYTSEMKKAAQEVRNLGLEPILVANPITISANGKRKIASGYHSAGKIFVQANSRYADVRTITEHEIYHELSEKNPEMVEKAKKAFRTAYGQEGFDELYAQYEKLYVDAYAGKNVSSETVARRIVEEMLADAYANRDRYKKGQSYIDAARTVKNAAVPEVENRTVPRDTSRYQNVSAEDVLENAEQESEAGRVFREKTEEDAVLRKLKRQFHRGEISRAEYERQVDRHFEQRLRKEIDEVVTAEGSMSFEEESEEDQEAYWNSIMEDPYAQMPSRIRLADKITMEAWAKENGYPEQNGIQIVPGVTWVKAKARKNYGRVLGKSENGAFMVMFENRKKGTEAVVEYRADEFEAVQGELQYEGKDVDREDQIATVPEEKQIEEQVQEEEAEPQGDDLTQQIRHTAGGLESFMVAQPQKVRKTLEKKLEFSASDLAAAMGVENSESLQSIVKRLADEYMELGTISSKTENQTFEEVISKIEKPEQQTEQEFRAWARSDFLDGIGHLMSHIKVVRRYIKTQMSAKAAGKQTEGKEQDIEKLWSEAKTARREMEKAKVKYLLTPEDRVMIGRLLKGHIQMEDINPNVYNVRGIREVFEASQKYEDLMKMLRAYNAARREANRAMARELVKDPEKWKDKKRGTGYMTETMERNVEDIAPDEETAKALNDWAFTPVHKNEAESNKLKTELRERVKALNLKTGKPKGKNKLSESAAVQLLGEAQDNIAMLEHKPAGEKRDGKTLEEWQAEVANIWTENPELDQKKIEKAVKEFREIYDLLFRKMNEARIRNGYEPINYRKGYFPHFQNQEADGVIAAFGKAFGITTEVANLPATINGMTESFKPGVRWFGHALERMGVQTTLDAVQGFDQYLEGSADIIFHTDDIQRLRALESEIRYQAGTEAIRERADQIRAREDLTDAQKSKEIEELFADAPFALSKFVVEIHEYTNNLANKKSKFDRWFEDMMGRNAYNVMKAMEGRVAANMVALNPGSWLTNFAPLVQGQTSIGDRWILAGMWQENVNFLNKVFKKQTDGFPERSVFLTNRRGSERLMKTKTQKVSETLTGPMGWIDNFVSDSLVRAKYMKNIKDGLSSEAAMDDADAWAARIMADRSKGAMPTVFNQKNPITKLFTQYQLEVKNSFSWLLKDLPREKRKKGIARIAWALLSYAIRAYIFNDLYEFFVGRRPAFDPADMLLNTAGDIWGFDVPNLVDAIVGKDRDFEDEKAEAAELAGNLFQNVMEEMPFVGGLIGGGRLPISSALPDWEKLGSAVLAKTDDPSTETKEGMSKDQKARTIFNELIKPGMYIIPPFGGGQVKKIVESVRAFEEHGSYSASGELRYPVYTSGGWSDWETYATGLLFGTSSLDEAVEWVDSGFDNLNEQYTNAYRTLIEQGETDRKAYEVVKTVADAKKTETESAEVVKRQVLQGMDADEETKLTVYYSVLASDREQELIYKLGEEDAETVYSLMNAMYGAKFSEKNEIIKASGLSEAGKEAAWLWTKGSSENSQMNADERLKLAKKYDLYIGEVIDAESIGANFDTLEKLGLAGLSSDTAYTMTMALRGEEIENGKDENLDDLDRFDVILENTRTERERLIAIETMTARKDLERMVIAKDYLSTDQYQSFLRAFQKAYPGEKINQERVEDVLSGMKLTNEMRAVIWQIATNGKDGKKNPFDDDLGKEIYDLVNGDDEDGIDWAGR